MNTMAMYLIGDVQGCNAALQQLLDKITFSPSRDVLLVLGDLVNRGPDSAGVLRLLSGLGASASCLLGNHDLHLLAIAHGARKPHRKDTLDGVLHAADRLAMLDWLQHQRLAMLETIGGKELLMVHAGVLPAWTAIKTIALACEVETVLRSADAPTFFHTMYGNAPSAWTETLAGTDRNRVIVNALTRLRFCTPAGDMEFDTKDGADTAPVGYLPWFEVPDRKTGDVTVAFGHWSTLGHLDRTDVLSMDTGCVWGGCLSALRLDVAQPPGTGWTGELIQVQCEQAQAPGKP
jgi:bis(5'-nucleosyl)-tetraphosphatase (symmetrical)